MTYKNLITAFLLFSCLGFFSCAVPITTSKKYPIDVLYENQNLEIPFSEIGWIEISSEDDLQPNQTKNKRMLDRGNDAKTKEILTGRLVAKAQSMGADALIQVQYKYYSTVNSEGYLFKGLAVRYRGK
jgi:hypothetical protein